MKLPNSFKLSSKHIQIDNTYAKMVVAIAGAAAIVIFSIVVSMSLIKQIQYQNKVIGLRNDASVQLKKNLQAISPLVASYKSFSEAPESVLGNADNNAKIVLDALPSKYDFPALATSLEYIVQKSGVTFKGISGIDNETTAEQSSADPQPIEIPIALSVSGGYGGIQNLVSNLEKSIRPIKTEQISFTGSDAELAVSITAKTYYQPGKKLEIKQITVPGTSAKNGTSSTTTGGGN